MKYQLRATIYCAHQSDFDDVLDKLDGLKPEMQIINPGQDNQEASTIELLENNHDLDPNEPCTLIHNWDNAPH